MSLTSKISKGVEKWLNISNSDLRDAKSLLELDSKYIRLVVFLSQQSVEKALKAYLTHFKQRFIKTHEIEELIKQVRSIDKSLAESLYPASDLTEFAIAYRYPDAAKGELTLEIAGNSVKTADEAVNAIINTLLKG